MSFMLSIRIKKLLPLIIFVGLAVQATGCGAKEVSNYHYLVARKMELSPQTTLTLTVVRKFEKESWCADEAARFTKRGFTAECRYNDTSYEPALRGEAIGKWYLLQRIGRFPPLAIIYEFNPPLPDDVILYNLEQMAPHAVKFAAFHRAPAEAIIFSPEGDIRLRKTFDDKE